MIGNSTFFGINERPFKPLENFRPDESVRSNESVIHLRPLWPKRGLSYFPFLDTSNSRDASAPRHFKLLIYFM